MASRGTKVCLVTLALVIAITVTIVILAFTVFKPKNPMIKVDSIDVKDMDLDFNIFALSVDLNVTLDVDVSVENPNTFGFKYSDTTAVLNYRGQKVGDAPVPSEEITSKETKGLNLTLTLMASRLMSHPLLYKDVSMNSVPLSTFLSISGEVKILGFIKFHVDVTSTCDFKINLANQKLEGQRCQSTTKI